MVLDHPCPTIHGQLKDFHCHLNQLSSSITLSLEHTGESPAIPFLDVNLSIVPDEAILTELYVKPTHSSILLHYNCAHPKSTKESIAYLQLRRTTTVTSTEEGATRGTKKMTDMLLSNGYPKETLRRARSKVTTKPMPPRCH